jgi:uncharacterized membrane protein YgcG
MIEVGYGLEGALTDVICARIIREVITPRFREGDFYGGISDGLNRVIGVVEGEPLPAPTPMQRNTSPRLSWPRTGASAGSCHPQLCVPPANGRSPWAQRVVAYNWGDHT